MVRTQVYLTKIECNALAALAEATGKKQSELIREAVDRFIEQSSLKRRDRVLDRAAGMWADRTDLPDFRALRTEWDRFPLTRHVDTPAGSSPATGGARPIQ